MHNRQDNAQEIEIHSVDAPVARLILAHGAGAGMQHEFMQHMAQLLNKFSIEVVLFNFPYMQTIVATGKRRPPNKAEQLLAHFSSVIHQVTQQKASKPLPTFVGGKSMGGRMATMLLDNEESILGAVVFGYPFHPPGKPDKLRTGHLATLKKPTLIVQGERDTFGTQQEVSDYTLSSAVTLAFLPDGDHSFKPRKKSGYSLRAHCEQAAKLAADFMRDTAE